MKKSLLLAFIASTALAASAFAQSSGTTSGTTTGTGSTTGTDVMPSATGSSGTGSSGTTSGSSSGAGAGSQTANPNIHGSTSGAGATQQYGGGPFASQNMGSAMNCVSPAPMGGPGSFACYPSQQMGQGGYGYGMGGMGMGGMGMGGMGWHPHMWNDGYPGGYGDPRRIWPPVHPTGTMRTAMQIWRQPQ